MILIGYYNICKPFSDSMIKRLGVATTTFDYCVTKSNHTITAFRKSRYYARARLLRRFAPPKKIEDFYRPGVEIAAVASLLRNDGIGRFSFICILRIR